MRVLSSLANACHASPLSSAVRSVKYLRKTTQDDVVRWRRAFGRGRMRGSRAVRREAYDAATRTARARVSSDLELTSARTCGVQMAR